jgi:IS30 family transposase
MRLTLEEREDIAYCRAQRMGVRQIAAVMDRDPATISRELRRGMSSSPWRYRAFQAHLEGEGQLASTTAGRRIVRCGGPPCCADPLGAARCCVRGSAS